jgi:Tfp pilus assembly protein PilE
MTSHKVKAYTILELAITMLLSALVISIAYTAYRMVNQSYLSFTIKNNHSADLMRLDNLLKKDFFRADQITCDSAGILCHLKDHSVCYIFTRDFIIRKAGLTDTFKFKVENITPWYSSQQLQEALSESTGHYVDALDFNLIFRDEKVPFTYHKCYSSTELINANVEFIK